MKIFLTGYMGSGKSVVGQALANKLSYKYVDLDNQIELVQGRNINAIFEARGELFFRKLESKILDDILANNANMVISLGGGTPCYGNNLDRIRAAPLSKTIYLNATVEVLTARLFPEKIHRPVISHLETRDQLEEFIRKHLFERAYYYNQSDISIKVDHKSVEAVTEEIKRALD